MREGLRKTKKGGPKQIKKYQKVKKWDMGGGRGGVQWCTSIFSLVTKGGTVRKSIKCRFGA